MLLLSLIRSCRMVILTFSERKNRGLLFQNGTANVLYGAERRYFGGEVDCLLTNPHSMGVIWSIGKAGSWAQLASARTNWRKQSGRVLTIGT